MPCEWAAALISFENAVLHVQTLLKDHVPTNFEIGCLALCAQLVQIPVRQFSVCSVILWFIYYSRASHI